MLNYTHRYEFDNNLAMACPSPSGLQTGKNMVVRFVEQPGMFFAYSKFKQLIDNTDIPEDSGDVTVRYSGRARLDGTQYINHCQGNAIQQFRVST